MPRIKYKEAIGLAQGRGKPSIGKRPSEPELRRFYIKESKSIREIAEILGCSKDMVYRVLHEYKIELRPGFNRSKLRKYRLSDIEEGIREKGVRGYARELGIHENTLRHYLKGKREEK